MKLERFRVQQLSCWCNLWIDVAWRFARAACMFHTPSIKSVRRCEKSLHSRRLFCETLCEDQQSHHEASCVMLYSSSTCTSDHTCQTWIQVFSKIRLACRMHLHGSCFFPQMMCPVYVLFLLCLVAAAILRRGPFWLPWVTGHTRPSAYGLTE